MTLKKWVYAKGGPGEVAGLLGVKEHAVRVWLRGNGAPRPLVMARIVRLSKRTVSYDTIINESLKNKY